MADNSKQVWHWDQGVKIATEAIKMLFILNGASAVALLTFIGNSKTELKSLLWALVLFALGAAVAISTFFFAYYAQLHYGNAEGHRTSPTYNLNPEEFKKNWGEGQKYHGRAYWPIIVSILLFLAAIAMSALAFWG